MDWYKLGTAETGNPITVAFALGYCLRTVKRSDGHGYNIEVVSILGKESIGFSKDEDKAQEIAEQWVKRVAKNHAS